MTAEQKFQNVDAYIDAFPENAKAAMELLRKTIKNAAPDAEEVISYAMPGYKQNGVAIWFAAYKNHYAIYVRPKIHEAFAAELAPYKQTKSAVHFLYGKPLPEKLVTDITQFAVAENLKDFLLKKASKAKKKIDKK
ncbi:iron chaperone [Flavobacterium sp. 3HN19-14]|uniref:iron chaperone n=1 Tax=Flavobacterium sp. 3HN19-14 TaxID=3448133 RepID=UPI003EDF481A